MSAAQIPSNEAERLRSLNELGVLDSGPEREFDALVQAAALVCGVPISLISLIDVDRQWFKANTGMPGFTETPRDLAFCAHAILQDGIFEVPDATLDPRFADNDLVTGAPDIRFYAGAPLRLSDGIGHLEDAVLQDGMGAEGQVARRFSEARQAGAGLEPLAVDVDQADQRDRHAAHQRSGLHQSVELALGRGVKDAELIQRTKPLGFVGGNLGCRH